MGSSSNDRSQHAVSQLDEVIADYVRAVERGSAPDRDHLVAQHPDIAEELREFFRHRDRLESLIAPLRDTSNRVLHIRCPHCSNSIELLDNALSTNLDCPSCGSSFSLLGSQTHGQLNGTSRIGQFELLEHVGMGQFGSVWKARDLTLERIVALKIPRRRQMTSADAEILLRDARVSALLNHPNIVSVHEVGKYEDAIYIVSDFVEGASLKEWMATTPLRFREIAELAATIAQALHYAHEAGVIHRDLKPSNIMMNQQGQPHIVDFGLAKRDAGGMTMTADGQILGTPAYMSPEQARGDSHDVDRKADIYSMGVILYELLTRKLPFEGSKEMLIVHILNDEPPPPRKIEPAAPRDLQTICLKCMRKEPGHRYASARELGDDLQRWLDGKPIVARPVPQFERAWLWSRRHPAVTSLLALMMVVVIGAVIIGRQIQQRERAHAAVQTLLHAGSDDVLRGVQAMRSLKRYVTPVIDQRLTTRLTDKERFHLALARFVLDGSDVAFLQQHLLNSEPQQLLLIRNTLKESAAASVRSTCVDAYWKIATDSARPSGERLRAAGALADLDPDTDRWTQIADEVVAHIVAQPLGDISAWAAVFQPVGAHLERSLESVFRESRATGERNAAITLLGNYAAADADKLLNHLALADAEQLGGLVSRLQRHKQALPLLKQRFESTWLNRGVQGGELPTYPDVPATIVERLKASAGIIGPEFALGPALAWDTLTDTLQSLADCGYRPLRLRPYHVENQQQVAILWTRDGRGWRVDTNLTEEELLAKQTAYRDDKFVPVDVAGYLTLEGWRCAAVWGESERDDNSEYLLSVLRPSNHWRNDFESNFDSGFVPHTIQVATDVFGYPRRSQVWRRGDGRSLGLQRSALSELPGEYQFVKNGLLTDVSVYPSWHGLRFAAVGLTDTEQATVQVVHTPLDGHRSASRHLAVQGYTPVSVDAVRELHLSLPTVVSVWQRPMLASFRIADFHRARANLAIAMMMLDDCEAVVDLLQHGEDDSLRTHLIEHIGRAGVDPQTVMELLDRDSVAPDVRQAVILCLQGYDQVLIPYRTRIIPRLARLYRDDPHAGVHAAASLILRNWNVPLETIAANDSELPTQEGEWYVDKAGNTMVIVQLPHTLPFVAGLTRPVEGAGRIIAVSANEMTADQVSKLLKDRNSPSASADRPASDVTWFDAIACCESLNELHGIDSDQSCYLPNADHEFAQGMRIPSNFAARTGYRLMSPVEFRYAGGALATTHFSFGDAPELLPQYAWFAGNSVEQQPVATRIPNVFGLFDIHGNITEWLYGPHDDDSRADLTSDQRFIASEQLRSIAGGSFKDNPLFLGRNFRITSSIANRASDTIGFRVARTIVPASADLSAAAPPLDDWETAHWFGRQGKWREAADQMCQSLPDWPTDIDAYTNRAQQLFPLLLYLEETENARNFRDETIRRFGDTEDPDMAHRILGLVLHIPDAEMTTDATRLVNISARSRNVLHQRDRAIYYFRKGEYRQAKRYIERALDSNFLTGKSVSFYYLAMIEFALEDPVAARNAYREAEASREQITTQFRPGDYGPQWNVWPMLESIRRETEAKLGAAITELTDSP